MPYSQPVAFADVQYVLTASSPALPQLKSRALFRRFSFPMFLHLPLTNCACTPQWTPRSTLASAPSARESSTPSTCPPPPTGAYSPSRSGATSYSVLCRAWALPRKALVFLSQSFCLPLFARAFSTTFGAGCPEDSTAIGKEGSRCQPWSACVVCCLVTSCQLAACPSLETLSTIGYWTACAATATTYRAPTTLCSLCVFLLPSRVGSCLVRFSMRAAKHAH